MKQKFTDHAQILGSGKEVSIPENTIGLFFYIVRYHYAILLNLNLLFIACCLPIVTIPAACCAMDRVLLRLIDGKPVFLWNDFWTEMKQDFPKRLGLWLLMSMAPFSLAFYMTWFGLDRKGTGTRLFCLVLLFLVQNFWFLCMALIETSPGKNLKNAIILMAIEWKKTVQVLLSVGIIYGLCFFFPLYSFPAILFGLFSACQLLVCIMLKGTVLTHLQLS